MGCPGRSSRRWPPGCAVLDAARDRGQRVPADIAVAGWDDSPDAQRAELTTVTQSLFDQGRTCALIALGDTATGAPGWTVSVRATTR